MGGEELLMRGRQRGWTVVRRSSREAGRKFDYTAIEVRNKLLRGELADLAYVQCTPGAEEARTEG